MFQVRLSLISPSFTIRRCNVCLSLLRLTPEKHTSQGKASPSLSISLKLVNVDSCDRSLSPPLLLSPPPVLLVLGLALVALGMVFTLLVVSAFVMVVVVVVVVMLLFVSVHVIKFLCTICYTSS
jgi:hypothetical protein